MTISTSTGTDLDHTPPISLCIIHIACACRRYANYLSLSSGVAGVDLDLDTLLGLLLLTLPFLMSFSRLSMMHVSSIDTLRGGFDSVTCIFWSVINKYNEHVYFQYFAYFSHCYYTTLAINLITWITIETLLILVIKKKGWGHF